MGGYKESYPSASQQNIVIGYSFLWGILISLEISKCVFCGIKYGGKRPNFKLQTYNFYLKYLLM
jgi:hypothetical protein